MSQFPNQSQEVPSSITLTATLGKATSIPVKEFIPPSLPKKKNHTFMTLLLKL